MDPEWYQKLLSGYKSIYKDPTEDLDEWRSALHSLQITEEYAGKAMEIMHQIVKAGIGLPPRDHPHRNVLISSLAHDLTEWMKSDVYMGLLMIIADAGI